MQHIKNFTDFVNESVVNEGWGAHALSNGNFSIKNLKDLKISIDAWETGIFYVSQRAEIIAHIIKRARVLDAVDLLSKIKAPNEKSLDKEFQKALKESINEKYDFTFADAVETADENADNEEKVFAKYLKYIGAKDLDDAYLIFTSNQDEEYEDDFKPIGKDEIVKGSDLYLSRTGNSRVQTGTIKGVKAFTVSDGQNEFCYVGKAGAKKLS